MSETYEDDMGVSSSPSKSTFQPIAPHLSPTRQTTIEEHYPQAHPQSQFQIDAVKNYKEVTENFFEDTSLYFSYFLSNRILPTDPKILDQYGFTICQTFLEKKQLLNVYGYVIFVGYQTEVPFLYKRLQLLHQSLLEDKLEEFILIGYGLQRFQDDFFYWFIRNSMVVKHGRSYAYFIHLKASLQDFFRTSMSLYAEKDICKPSLQASVEEEKKIYQEQMVQFKKSS